MIKRVFGFWGKMRLAVLFFLLWLMLPACVPRERVELLPEPYAGLAFVSDRDGNDEIYRMQASGKALTRLTTAPALDSAPAWSPDGRYLAFHSRRDGSSDIFVMGADGSHSRNLARDPKESLDDEFRPTWHPDGQLLALYTDRYAGVTCAVHQLAMLPLSGGLENISPVELFPSNQISFAWAPDGRRLAFSSVPCQSSDTRLYVWNRDTGEVRDLTDETFTPALYPTWSPDGALLAFASAATGEYDIYVLDLDSGEVTNLTQDPARDTRPSWSPDGARIAFTTNRDGNDEIYTMNADGTDLCNLTRNPARDFDPAWSPVIP